MTRVAKQRQRGFLLNPFRFGGGGGGGGDPWTPASITTALWLDASDSGTVTLDVSDNVSAWNDKSGNGWHATQATAGSRPGYDVNKLNALPTVNFPGGFKSVANASYTAEANKTAITRFIVLRMTTTSNCVSYTSGGADTIIQRRGAERWTYQRPGVNRYNNGGGADLANWSIVGQVLDGSQAANHAARIKPYLNGAAWAFASTGGSINTVTANTNGYTVGGVSAAPMVGDIAEVVTVDGAMSDSIRQKMEGYLAHKWGLTASLPGDHPYKTDPPTV